MRNCIKKRMPALLWDLFKKSYWACRSQISRYKIQKLVAAGCPLRVDLGAGSNNIKSGWISLDVSDDCDIFWDLSLGLPFPPESVAEIYSAHLLEHFSFLEIQRLLQECKRVLVPGGVFSVCVPNARIYAEAYVGGQKLDKFAFCGYVPAFNDCSGIDYLNYVAYMGGQHKHMFDEENLLTILERAGFSDVKIRGFNPELDSENRKAQSVYAEALK